MPMNVDDPEEDRKVSTEYVRMYYEHQYDRMAKLEEQRLMITSVVITISTVAFTFGFSNIQDLTALNGLGLPAVMVLSNLLAIAYIVHSADVIRAHGERAKKVLAFYAQDLYQLDKSIQWSRRLPERWKTQLFIHIILILTALFPVYIYLRSII